MTTDTHTTRTHDDHPVSVPQAELRSAACITVPADWMPSNDLQEGRIQGGRYARIVHTGPYAELHSAYDWLYRSWLPSSGVELRNLPCLELYLNSPREVPANYLRTAVLLPLE